MSIPFGEKQLGRARLLGFTLSIGFFAGCASSSSATSATPTTTSTLPTTKNETINPDPTVHLINGTGTSEDRSAITTSNQQILNVEHARSGSSSPASPTPYGGIP